MEIKVMGPGCAKCNEVMQAVEEIIAESGVAASVQKVSDFQEMAKHGVFATPSLVIDGQVKSTGKVPRKDEIRGWMGV
ncbi:MAG: thioredoxin family protein [Desulfurivibrio sp.]|nr:thioredoxin family protein [Desulfurivibrio sp.]